MPEVPPTLRVTVMLVELLKEIEAEVMSWPDVKVMLGKAKVLNSKPAGALSTSVTPEPALKSNLFRSSMIIEPSVVQAGEDALAALSAGMLVPPMAAVTVTEPKAWPASRAVVATTKSQQSKTRPVLGRIICARSEFSLAFNSTLPCYKGCVNNLGWQFQASRPSMEKNGRFAKHITPVFLPRPPLGDVGQNTELLLVTMRMKIQLALREIQAAVSR